MHQRARPSLTATIALVAVCSSLNLVSGCSPRSTGTTAAPPPPLASWNEGPAKAAILRLVANTTTLGNPGYVPAAERIAVFDNDGTLWAEQPCYAQLQFALDRVKALAPQHPEWRTQAPFDHLLAGDMKAFMAGGEQALAAIVAASHSGLTTEEFAAVVKDWLRTAMIDGMAPLIAPVPVAVEVTVGRTWGGE